MIIKTIDLSYDQVARHSFHLVCSRKMHNNEYVRYVNQPEGLVESKTQNRWGCSQEHNCRMQHIRCNHEICRRWPWVLYRTWLLLSLFCSRVEVTSIYPTIARKLSIKPSNAFSCTFSLQVFFERMRALPGFLSRPLRKCKRKLCSPKRGAHFLLCRTLQCWITYTS